MTAQMRGTRCESVGPVTIKAATQAEEACNLTVENVTSGQYVLICGHPEAFSHKTGQAALRALEKKNMIKAVLVDEVHLGTEGHWNTIRPNMLRKVFSAKVYAIPKAPIGCFTATITANELRTVEVLAGRKRPMTVLAQGPIQRNFKVCLFPRPPSQVPFLGCTNSKGVFKPGLLHLLRLLVLDEFLSKYKAKDLESFPTTIVFFRNSDDMGKCNSYLIEMTGQRTYDTAPFAMNHSSLSSTDDTVIHSRRDKYKLFLSTNRMLLGVDIPGVQHVVMVRPPNLAHAIVQVNQQMLKRLDFKD